ncbi:hypothetical protein F503_04694 [Ophiostoma piceae UAMH 11346]|uniref:Uncharacterized protein n=1 Tax=Ophiostoma piceae (strain UAMH 11346) TaxID=1262450 RepID=S3BSB8_OPHP1|nr:hypothetical protein F503_04694 [Ophiostoma piceae UAMH 11346]
MTPSFVAVDIEGYIISELAISVLPPSTLRQLASHRPPVYVIDFADQYSLETYPFRVNGKHIIKSLLASRKISAGNDVVCKLAILAREEMVLAEGVRNRRHVQRQEQESILEEYLDYDLPLSLDLLDLDGDERRYTYLRDATKH